MWTDWDLMSKGESKEDRKVWKKGRTFPTCGSGISRS